MITSECGPHCGIVCGANDLVTREGHCNDRLCHAGNAPPTVTENRGQAAAPRDTSGRPLTGTPMCARWYENVQVLPWTAHLPGCLCGISAQALPQHHGTHCAMRQRWDRDHAPSPASSCPACGSEERAEAGYVPGISGQPVTCTSDWHDEDACSPGDLAGQAADEAIDIINATGA